MRTNVQVMFSILLLLVFVPVATAQTPASADARNERQHLAEFPAAEAQIAFLEGTGIRAKNWASLLEREPDSPEAVRVLMAQRRFDAALVTLRRIVDRHPERMEAAFTALTSLLRDMLADKARTHGETLRPIVADARKAAETLSREPKAQLARVLVTVDSELDRTRDSRPWRTRLAEFASEYAGTEVALLTEVDLLTDRIGPPMLAALDEFVKAHQGTTAAAKALYTKGFHLGHNAMSFGERPGHDPTERFFQVRAIASELRSGRYPPCEWVEKAQSLVVQFFAYKPVYSPENVDRLLAALEEELPSLMAQYQQDPANDSVAYFIGSRIGELLKLKGNPVPGLEQVFGRLEKSTTQPDAVRLLRAEMYLRPTDRVFDESDRAALRPLAETTLQSLAASSPSFYQRKALATLARLRFGDGAFEPAKRDYRRYVETYPTSNYAWVAALRIAQCEESLGNPGGAVTLFNQAAEQFRTNPVASVLARAYAARASEAVGNFPQALELYQSALSGWDLDYGARYSLFATRPARAGDPFMLTDAAAVVRESVSSRIGELKRSLSVTEGAALERGRWLIGRSQWSDAITALQAFLADRKQSLLAPTARTLLHRAQLEMALDLVDADKGSVNVEAAADALRGLSKESADYAVVAAKIALATLTFVTGSPGDPDELMADAMKTWQALDTLPAAKRTGVERDAIDVRNAVFQPKGGGVFESNRWNGFRWDGANTPYLVVNPELRVKSSDGSTTVVSAHDAFPELPNVLFLDPERRAILERVMLRLGGSKKLPWTQVMQTPNRPTGPSLDVLAFWKKSFWAQPGHWGGWVFESYPIITEIEFVDAERTRAAVKVTIGYSGGTVQLAKENGVWIAREITNIWIT